MDQFREKFRVLVKDSEEYSGSIKGGVFIDQPVTRSF
jgi:hypothetical protein